MFLLVTRIKERWTNTFSFEWISFQFKLKQMALIKWKSDYHYYFDGKPEAECGRARNAARSTHLINWIWQHIFLHLHSIFMRQIGYWIAEFNVWLDSFMRCIQHWARNNHAPDWFSLAFERDIRYEIWLHELEMKRKLFVKIVKNIEHVLSGLFFSCYRHSHSIVFIFRYCVSIPNQTSGTIRGLKHV